MRRFDFDADGEMNEFAGGRWVRYTDHVEAMKRIAGDGGQAEPVAWRHSHTLCLYETREDVPLADGDEWAVPLYLAAPAPTQGTQGEPCAGIAGELPEPTVGKLTAYIRSLQDKGQQRFYIDHGVIHDAITGKHVHGDRDVEPGVADEAVAMLNDLHARAVLAASPADQVEEARDSRYQELFAMYHEACADAARDARDAARYRIARRHVSVQQFCSSSGLPMPDLFGRGDDVDVVIDELCDAAISMDAAMSASKEGA